MLTDDGTNDGVVDGTISQIDFYGKIVTVLTVETSTPFDSI